MNFCFELARFGDWRILSTISSISYAFVGFVMLPVWLIVLACYLGQYAGAPPNDNREVLTANLEEEVGVAAPYSDAAGAASAVSIGGSDKAYSAAAGSMAAAHRGSSTHWRRTAKPAPARKLRRRV
jgi:hypothetical protein